jgi:hypothetical protein
VELVPTEDILTKRYTTADFKAFASEGHEGVQWIQELIAIKNLEELDVVPGVSFKFHTND